MSIPRNLADLIWLLIIPSVLLDSLNGFMVNGLTLDLKTSQLYKMLIFILMLIQLMKWQSKGLILFSSIFITTLVLPLYNNDNTVSNFVKYELVFSLKILMIIVSCTFFWEYAKRKSEQMKKYAHKLLNFSFYVVVVNVLSGYLGFGYNTYESSGIGFKGFFIAGNELSALFLLLSAYKAFIVWNESSLKSYVFFAILIAFVGVSIATKAGAVFGILITLLIPLASLRVKIFSIKYLFVLMVLLWGAGICIGIAFEDISNMTVVQKLTYNYKMLGFFGMLFSSRDTWFSSIYNHINDIHGISPLILGYGSTVTNFIIGKHSVEIDPVDVFMLYGLPTMLILLSLNVWMIVRSLRSLNIAYYAPCVLVVNTLLLFFASLAGHVWTSGMLGITWGAVNALMLVRTTSNNKKCLDS